MNIIGVTASCSSVWLIVAVTAERLLVIRFPLKAGSLTSRRRALMVIFTLTFFFVLLSMHFLLSAGLRQVQMTDRTEWVCEIQSAVKIDELDALGMQLMLIAWRCCRSAG